MQIIEVTGLGVRSAVITLRAPGSPLCFRLFPMMHVASPTFYRQVSLRLRECDLIVEEGVRGTSKEVGVLTMAYRFAPRFARNGLELQSGSYGKVAAPVINVDSTAAEVSAEIKTLPRLLRYFLFVAAPVLGLLFAVRGPRMFLDEDLTVDDLPLTHRAERLADNPVGEVLVAKRDRRLYAALDRLYTEYQDKEMVIAVVYGAAHIPGIAASLGDRHGYRPREAEWLTVCIPR